MAAVRDTYMSDYGISKSENEKLLEYCRNADETKKRTLLKIAERVYPEIAVQLFENLTTGIGYDNLRKENRFACKGKIFRDIAERRLKNCMIS